MKGTIHQWKYDRRQDVPRKKMNVSNCVPIHNKTCYHLITNVLQNNYVMLNISDNFFSNKKNLQFKIK